jgi:hypothetical protein
LRDDSFFKLVYLFNFGEHSLLADLVKDIEEQGRPTQALVVVFMVDIIPIIVEKGKEGVRNCANILREGNPLIS